VQAKPQQAIESREMIHMHVRNECMAHAQELARGQRRQIAQVEQQCPAREMKYDEQHSIRERIIDEPRLQEPRHVNSLRDRFTLREWGEFLCNRLPVWPGQPTFVTFHISLSVGSR